jgi:hypothetical protein
VKIAYYPCERELLEDQAFNSESPANANGAQDRWCALQAYLAARDIELHTYDRYGTRREVDLWILQEPVPYSFRFMLGHRIHPRRVIFMITEPPIINPWGWKWLRYYSVLFKAVLTWNSERCRKSRRFFHYHFPVRLRPEKYPHYRAKTKQNLCLMMHSNKTSKQPGELYSLRREIIRYFERRGDRLLDLFGHGWNTEASSDPFFTPLYKGTTPDKWETYSEYYFTFCIDNSVVPGYITYDPLISMATGSVPVYLPMPDSREFIPEDTFIDYTRFAGLDELAAFLQRLAASDEYEAYRRRGWEFITSERFRPFTIEQFCEDVYRAIRAVRGE